MQGQRGSTQSEQKLAMLGHELCSVLNGIQGMTELLGGSGLNGEQRQLLEATKLLKENIYQLPRMQAGDTHYCRQINTLENLGDAALKKALGDLFDQQPDACEIIKWKEVYEFIEEAMDRCEDAANLIEAVVTKNA